MTEGRALTRLVVLDGEVWEAGSVPPPEVAERIRNPQCWQTVEEPAAQTQPENRSGRIPEPDRTSDGLRNLEPQPTTTDSSAVAQPSPGTIIGTPAAEPAPVVEPEPVAPQDQVPLSEPPRSGKGATTAAWRAYARQFDVQVPPEADRADIIALLKDGGHIQ